MLLNRCWLLLAFYAKRHLILGHASPCTRLWPSNTIGVPRVACWGKGYRGERSGKETTGSQLLKVSFTAESNGAKRAYNRGVPRKPGSGRSLQGIKVMRVSWLDTTFHITVTNIKSIRRNSYVLFLFPYLRNPETQARILASFEREKLKYRGTYCLRRVTH